MPSNDVIEIFKLYENAKQIFASVGGKKTQPDELPRFDLKINKASMSLSTDKITDGSRFGASIRSTEGKYARTQAADWYKLRCLFQIFLTGLFLF